MIRKIASKKRKNSKHIYHHPAFIASLVMAFGLLLFTAKMVFGLQIPISIVGTSNSNPNTLQLNTFEMITIEPTLTPTPTTVNAPIYPTSTPTPAPVSSQYPPPLSCVVSSSYCCGDMGPRPTIGPGQTGCYCPDNTNVVCDSCPNAGLGSDPFCVFTPSSRDYNIYVQYAEHPKPGDPSCKEYCWGKPVIYLYPTKPTKVSVLLDIPGQITRSDPAYPVNGWQNITAYPDGKLVYNGKNYYELFYEDSVTKHVVPSTGMIIPISDIKTKITYVLTRLGLKPNEQAEFLSYWLPKLQALNSPYILFSILAPQQKQEVDKVIISPEPDTRIEFLAYFKPLDKPFSIKPLELPKIIPQRIGFTEVEWGGTIDY